MTTFLINNPGPRENLGSALFLPSLFYFPSSRTVCAVVFHRLAVCVLASVVYFLLLLFFSSLRVQTQRRKSIVDEYDWSLGPFMLRAYIFTSNRCCSLVLRRMTFD